MSEQGFFSTLSKWVNKVIVTVANMSLLFITLLVCVEVFSRKIFNVSFTFVTAMTSIFFPVLVFLAIILITEANEHIAVNYFFNKLSDKFKKIIALINRLIMLFFTVFMTYSSYQLTIDVVNINIPVINISRSWLYSSMVVAFFISSIILVIQFIAILNDKESGGTDDDLDYD